MKLEVEVEEWWFGFCSEVIAKPFRGCSSVNCTAEEQSAVILRISRKCAHEIGNAPTQDVRFRNCRLVSAMRLQAGCVCQRLEQPSEARQPKAARRCGYGTGQRCAASGCEGESTAICEMRLERKRYCQRARLCQSAGKPMPVRTNGSADSRSARQRSRHLLCG